MKGLCIALAVLVPASHAYTAGWQPGQPITRYLTSTASAPHAVPTAASDVPVEPVKPWSWKDMKFGLEDFLTSKPVAHALNRVGFNVSEQLAAARAGVPPRFAAGIPLITDNDYESIIHNETFVSEQEENDRVWALIVTVGPADPVSDYYDKVFNGAHNLTLEAGDMQNVRWGRIDYIAVTEITTRWIIWKSPMLVIAKDRGRTLRFYRSGNLKQVNRPDLLRDFLLSEKYEETPPWSGPWSPTGNRAPALRTFSKWAAYFYNWLAVTPRWLLLLVTGTIASTAMKFMHHWDAAPTAKATGSAPTVTVTPAAENEGSAVPTAGKKVGASPAKKRKGGKK